MDYRIARSISDLKDIYANVFGHPEMPAMDQVLQKIHHFGIVVTEHFPTAVRNVQIESDFETWKLQLGRADPGYVMLMARYARRIVKTIEQTSGLDNYHRFLLVKFGHYCRKPPQYANPPQPYGVTNDPYFKLMKEFMINIDHIVHEYKHNHYKFYGTIYISLKSPRKEDLKPWP